jgi:hypothetical protein
MVKRCFECDAFTTQKCGRCDRKCCNDHLYHATTGMTTGPASEVCWKCADEGGMVDHRAYRVLFFCFLASLCFWVLDLIGTTIPLDFFLWYLLGVSLLLLFTVKNTPSSKAQRARDDRFTHQIRGWIGATGPG